MTTYEFLGIFLLGWFLGRLFENYIIPIFSIKLNTLENKHTKQTTQLQQEIYEIQEQSQYEVKAPAIGFIQPDYEEEYYEDELD